MQANPSPAVLNNSIALRSPEGVTPAQWIYPAAVVCAILLILIGF